MLGLGEVGEDMETTLLPLSTVVAVVVVIVEDLAVVMVEDPVDWGPSGCTTGRLSLLEGTVGNDSSNLTEPRVAGINGTEGNSGKGLSDLEDLWVSIDNKVERHSGRGSSWGIFSSLVSLSLRFLDPGLNLLRRNDLIRLNARAAIERR